MNVGMSRSASIEERRAVINQVIALLQGLCVVTQADFRDLLAKHPLASGLRLGEVLARVRVVLPTVDVIRINTPTTSSHRVFSFRYQFWVLYRDEPQCHEAVATALFNHLDNDLFSLPKKRAHALLTMVLKDNGVKEEIAKALHRKLDDAFKRLGGESG